MGKAESQICSVKAAVIIVLANFLRFAVSNPFPPLFISSCMTPLFYQGSSLYLLFFFKCFSSLGVCGSIAITGRPGIGN